jgi:hypothetical protein
MNLWMKDYTIALPDSKESTAEDGSSPGARAAYRHAGWGNHKGIWKILHVATDNWAQYRKNQRREETRCSL